MIKSPTIFQFMKTLIRCTLALALAVSAPASAQTVTFTPAAQSMTVRAGQPFAVPILLDLTAADTLNVASFQGSFRWVPPGVKYDSLRVENASFVIINSEDPQNIRWGAFSSNSTFSHGLLATLYFTAPPGQKKFRLDFEYTAVGTMLGVDIVNYVVAPSMIVHSVPCNNCR
jgi:hypothetical protein